MAGSASPAPTLARAGALTVGLPVIAVLVAGLVLGVVAPDPSMTLGDRIAPFSILMFAVVGLVLALRRHDHPFGWILLACAGFLGIGGGSEAAMDTVPVALYRLFTWLSAWTWIPAIGLLGAALLVFPDGTLPSKRWRWVVGVFGAEAALIAAMAVALWPYRGPGLANVEESWPGLAGVLGQIALPLLLVGFVASVTSLFVRYRRGSQVVRLQLKWLLYAVALLAMALVLASINDYFGLGSQALSDVLGVGGLFFFPVAVAFSVLRYRLFEIDRLISRTLSYGALTAVLLTVYGGTVLGLRSVMPNQGSDLVVAASTLLVAALFQPLRRRLQSLVDRRFDRSRYDAQATIGGFGARIRDSVDVHELRADLVDVVMHAIRPSNAFVWLRKD